MVSSTRNSIDLSQFNAVRGGMAIDDAANLPSASSDRGAAPAASQKHSPPRTDRSRGRQHFGASNSFSQIVRDLLKKVRRDTDALSPEVYASDSDAAPNESGVRCMAATMVRIDLGVGSEVKSHAAHINQIEFGRETSRHAADATYRVGQSPAAAITQVGSAASAASVASVAPQLSQACEKALVEGIESGFGLYQFVSRRAHALPDQSKETPILHSLQRLLLSRQPNDPPVLIGGRYRITSIEAQPTQSTDLRHALLTVQDTTLPPSHANYTQTIPLTQAGLKFTGKLLDVPEITAASAALDAHHQLIPRHVRRAARQAGPTIYSHAGIGRNATLVTYRRITKLIRRNRITDEAVLAAVLRETINTERASCGKSFLHSDAQINALWLVLSQKLKDHIKSNTLPSTPAEMPEQVPLPAPDSRVGATHAAATQPLQPPAESSDQNGRSQDRVEELSGAPASSTHHAAPAESHEVAPVPAAPAAEDIFTLRPTARQPSITESPAASLRAAPAAAATAAHPLAEASTVDPFSTLERSDNPFHANWNTARALIRAKDKYKARRFTAAFDGAGLLKHLSDRQLAAVRKHLDDPLAIENDPAAKAVDPSRADMRAMLAALHGEVVPRRDPRLAAFSTSSFKLWENIGQGDCLFHALTSREQMCSLPPAAMQAVRERVARMRLCRADDERQVGSNWHEFIGIFDSADITGNALIETFKENGIPQELSNAQLAVSQRQPHTVSGDAEIEDWLNSEGNETQSVIVVDAQVGREAVVRFERNGGRESIDVHRLVKERDLSKADIQHGVRGWIGAALNDREANFSNRTPREVVLYRHTGHFQRIAGFARGE